MDMTVDRDVLQFRTALWVQDGMSLSKMVLNRKFGDGITYKTSVQSVHEEVIKSTIRVWC